MVTSAREKRNGHFLQEGVRDECVLEVVCVVVVCVEVRVLAVVCVEVCVLEVVCVEVRVLEGCVC